MEDRPPAAPDPAHGPSAAPPSPPAGPSPPPPPQGPAEPVIAWEQPGLDVFSGFFRTVGELLGAPRKAFERMPVTPSFGRPLAFAIIAGWIGVLAGTFWDLLLRGRVLRFLQEFAPSAGEEHWGKISAVWRALVALAAPLWLPIALLIGAGLLHLFLLLVGGAQRGFIATFRVQCYAWVTQMLAVFPVCGQAVGALWSLILTIIGLSAVHRISTGKATLAVLLPVLLCCGCVALAIALFGAAIFAALGSRP